jgi:hypothetical protein
LATSRSAVNYTFSNPETGKTDYIASRDQKQLRLEGGYQLSTKRIFLNKGGSKNKSADVTRERTITKSYSEYYNSGRCGSKSYRVAEVVTKNNSNKGSWVKIQPSMGMAFVPGASAAEITTNNQGSITNYEYNAGNWRTAFITGAGFAFGKNNSEKFIVSLNYLKGIGNLNTQTLITTSGSKSTTTQLSSAVSNWNLRVGVPINLTKKTSPKKQVIIIEERKEIKETQEIKQSKEGKKCGGYMYKCRRAA